ncbi:hypothetical protein GUITHDRAFT_156235 [Guillardia theta CCMP2712]|uniref:Uncharacterized protein n=2 Tax=Guillardia theta TaxID=55529 RepID=L1IA70_GUITC|nr:hypothetical protein GUITHDRAFT_156235 [Guillardia theta CCMP2712]EKX32769.1 hypothetical protein GUITHDRAFT_156235 [Guillardia theta CCMP2712]|eukprot:XP_005819749.1 hypothetical protein GUITHDRAFT_156235 [Guillardia theta CCMP2712]
MLVGRVAFIFVLISCIDLSNADCPKVKTNMESWDWSPLSGVQVQFTNTTTRDGNSKWTVHLCNGVYSNLHDYGTFTGGAGSIKFHQPSDTFYMMYENGDRGQGCETNARQADVYIHCQGCPSYLEQSNSACNLQSAPCVCAAYDTGCVGEVHMVVNCPVGIPNYRKGFDVYDASTGIEEDISKVVIKDGEVMPGWTDEDIPSVAHDRAVIPGDVSSAVFYLMMADEDLQGLPASQEVDAPDVFTDQPHILAVTMSGSAARGGLVDTRDMLMLQLDFHCYQTGLADVHVEISFANQYYPCDFAFTYECGMGESGSDKSNAFTVFVMVSFLLIVAFCVMGCAYNYSVQQRRGEDIIPGIEYIHMARDLAEALMSRSGGVGGFSSTSRRGGDSTEGYQTL